MLVGCASAAPTPPATWTPVIQTVHPTRTPGATPRPKGATTTPQDGLVVISVGEDFFYPNEITIKAGTEVEWSHDGARAHNVTSTIGDWSSIYLDVSIRYRLSFNKPGVYKYICTFHPGMTGTIIVVD